MNKLEVNFTVFRTDDYFEDVYNSPILNWTLAFLLLLNLLGCAGLATVSWFERSGQAGPYRTLVNQMSTFCREYVIFTCSVPFGILSLRSVTGPLPEGLCSFADFTVVFSGITTALSSLFPTIIKVFFIFFFKSIPVMDDNFFALFLFLFVNMIGLIGSSAKFSYDQSPMVAHRICTGQWTFDYVDKRNMPIFILGCLAANGVFSLVIKLAKKESNNVLVPHNHQGSNFTNFGSMALTWIKLVIYSLLVGGFFLTKKMELEQLNSTSGRVVIMMTYTVLPCLCSTMEFIFLVIAKKELRKAIKGLIVSNSANVHPVIE